MPESSHPETALSLAALLQSSSDAIFFVDAQAVIQMWNPAATRLLGYDPEAIVGSSIGRILPDGKLEAWTRITGDSRRAGPEASVDAVLRMHDGRPIHVALHLAPVDEHGETPGAYWVTALDLEARSRNDRARLLADARWRALIDAAVDGMVVINARGIIEVFNPAAERLFGYRSADVLGRNVSLLMPPPDSEQHDEYLARYLRTGQQKIIGIGRDVTGLRSDGVRFPAHLSVGEMRVGDERHFVGIIHDLRGRNQLEERVREQASLARLGEMAAVLAHEVRNPLAAVRGAIQVLARRFPHESQDASVAKEVLARLDGLNALVQDLLLFGRTPTPRLTSVELRQILASTADLLSTDPLFAGVKVEIAGDAPPLSVDPELLKIAFQNVMLNAAQALQSRGSIRATVEAIEGRQVVAIADSGPGIPPAVRAQLFQPFYTTKARGTGLGLATVKRLVEAHHGTVSVSCPDQGGTVVTFQFPITAPPA